METGKPKPIIKDILELVKDEWSGWKLALWFISANGYLDGKTPLEAMDTEPGAVLETLGKEAMGIPSGQHRAGHDVVR